ERRRARAAVGARGGARENRRRGTEKAARDGEPRPLRAERDGHQEHRPLQERLTRVYSRNRLASPRKARKPITSVTVVSTTLEATAGSTFSFSSPSGTSAPTSAAATRLISMAAAMMTPIMGWSNHSQ